MGRGNKLIEIKEHTERRREEERFEKKIRPETIVESKRRERKGRKRKYTREYGKR